MTERLTDSLSSIGGGGSELVSEFASVTFWFRLSVLFGLSLHSSHSSARAPFFPFRFLLPLDSRPFFFIVIARSAQIDDATSTSASSPPSPLPSCLCLCALSLSLSLSLHLNFPGPAYRAPPKLWKLFRSQSCVNSAISSFCRTFRLPNAPCRVAGIWTLENSVCAYFLFPSLRARSSCGR